MYPVLQSITCYVIMFIIYMFTFIVKNGSCSDKCSTVEVYQV